MTIKGQEVLSTGIVLSSKPYKESDALVTVYFKDYGKMTLVAKGIKKLKSKNSPAMQTMTCSEITFIPRSGLSLLIKASAVDYYRQIKEDIVLEAYASYFMEFVLKNEEDNEPDLEVYENLKLALEALDQGYHYQLVYLLYSAFMLKVCGSPLHVDGCVRCFRQNDIVGISLHDGGFVCSSCFSSQDYQEDKDVLKAFRHINKYSLKDLDRISYDEKTMEPLIRYMDYFVDEFTGLLLKSRKFIKQLSKL